MPSTNYFSTQSWVVPADCRSIDVFDCTGGGASGVAGGPSNGYSTIGNGGYGGGGGARAVKNNIAVTPGETLTIYVGGVGGYSGLYRNSTSTWLCLAYGAGGQTGGSPSVYDSGWTGASGASGTASYFDSIGQMFGGHGGNGGGSNLYGGGGPGGAGGELLAYGAGNPQPVPGSSGSNYGGGGGGGGGSAGTNNNGSPGNGAAGGAGHAGIATLTYTPSFPPTVSSISVSNGQISGGDTVVITGTNFNYTVSQVWFGATAAASFTVNSATQITAVTPAHAQGVVDVTVTNQYATSPVSAADKFSFLFTNWADNALFSPGPTLRATTGLNLPIKAGLSAATGVAAAISDRQQFISAQIGITTSIISTLGQPKGIFAGLFAGTTFAAATAGAKFISSLLQPSLNFGSIARHTQNGKAKINLGVVLGARLGQITHLPNVALFTADTGVTAKPNLPEAIGLSVAITTGFDVHEIPVKFIGAGLEVQTGLVADVIYVPYPYDSYGSQVLYREASGLEKAMIDADQPRITGIPAEAINDTWNPYACPANLLPYLAWAMGVNFWNPKWSEETKRAWIASQWQFKAWRGTDAAIDMAVDFAGRDVSPYGYSVRKITTQPQGQYPSPGITHVAQEEWLATLPQVRVYLFAQHGQAYVDEFYVNVSYLGTKTWKGQTYITPDTSRDRLGKKATWNVHGKDISEVSVTNFGNYFQLHMPGQAYEEELYNDEGWTNYSFLTPSDAWKRLVTITPLTQSPYRIAVGPSLRAIEATPDLIAQNGTAGYDVFIGSNFYPRESAGVFMAPADKGEVVSHTLNPVQNFPIFPSYFVPNTADFRLFYRYPVFDPDDLPTGGTQGTMFMGVGWLDFPPFTAEIDVFMAGNRCAAEFTTGDFLLPNGRYFIPQDNEPTAYVAGAIEAARKLTDLTLIQPKPTPVFSAGKPFIAGHDRFVVGQPQLSA